MFTIKSIPKVHNLTIALVGDTGVGKTALMKQLTADKFTVKHVPSEIGAYYALYIDSNYGVVLFNVYEYNSIVDLPQKMDKFDGALVMFSVNDSDTFASVPGNCAYFDIECIYTVLAGNKTDIECQEVSQRMVQNGLSSWNLGKGYRKDIQNIEYHGISAKNMDNAKKPFLTLAQFFIKKDLQFI